MPTETIKHKASLDTLAKIVTLVVILLFVFIAQVSVREIINPKESLLALVMNSGIILLLAGILLTCWLFAPKFYSVDLTMLIIHRPGRNRVIHLSEIDSVQLLDKQAMSGTIRAFAVGGLFGYFGKFLIPKFGPVSVYATQMSNFILIRTKMGEFILLTPDDVTLVEKLQPA